MTHEYKWKNSLKNLISKTGIGVTVSVDRLKRDGVDVDKLVAAMPKGIEATVSIDTSTSPGNGLVTQAEYLVLMPAIKKR